MSYTDINTDDKKKYIWLSKKKKKGFSKNKAFEELDIPDMQPHRGIVENQDSTEHKPHSQYFYFASVIYCKKKTIFSSECADAHIPANMATSSLASQRKVYVSWT